MLLPRIHFDYAHLNVKEIICRVTKKLYSNWTDYQLNWIRIKNPYGTFIQTKRPTCAGLFFLQRGGRDSNTTPSWVHAAENKKTHLRRSFFFQRGGRDSNITSFRVPAAENKKTRLRRSFFFQRGGRATIKELQFSTL